MAGLQNVCTVTRTRFIARAASQRAECFASFSFKAKLPLINNFSRFLHFPLVKHQLITRYKQSSRRDRKPRMSNPTSDFPSLTQTVWSRFPFESSSWWSLRKKTSRNNPSSLSSGERSGCRAATSSPSCPAGPDRHHRPGGGPMIHGHYGHSH